MRAKYQWGRLELMCGWSSNAQPNNEYLTRFWGLAIEAVFIGFVTALKRKGVA